jgi:osmotically-inducible protein OsmY
LDIQSDIDSDAHPDISTRSQLDRSSADSDLQSTSPEQGAPAITPDSGSDRSSLQSEATLQQSERTDLNSDESKSSSDYRSERSQSDLNAPANDTQLRQENSVDSGNAPSTSSEQNKSSEFKSDNSSSSVDTTVQPNLTYDTTKAGSSDLSFSEKIRTGLTTGSEGRPAAFNSTMLQDVKIDSHAGLITLRGKVSSDQEKKDIEARVKEMPGVTSVNNMLEVTSGSDSTGPEIK